MEHLHLEKWHWGFLKIINKPFLNYFFIPVCKNKTNIVEYRNYLSLVRPPGEILYTFAQSPVSSLSILFWSLVIFCFDQQSTYFQSHLTVKTYLNDVWQLPSTDSEQYSWYRSKKHRLLKSPYDVDKRVQAKEFFKYTLDLGYFLKLLGRSSFI